QRSVEVVHAICSLPFEQALPTTIATWLRQHWRIENNILASHRPPDSGHIEYPGDNRTESYHWHRKQLRLQPHIVRRGQAQRY
ncbi:hypothetical protein, partial [Mycobacterium marinum]